MKTQFGGMAGVVLLQILDEEVKILVRDSNHKNHSRCHYWVRMCGRMVVGKSAKHAGTFPLEVVLGSTVKVTGNPEQPSSERVQFPVAYGTPPKNDLNYQQISMEIEKILKRGKLLSRGLAIELLQRMMGGPSLLGSAAEDVADGKFLDALVVLMFGVEASRNQATLATSVFLLDLIRAGCTYGRNGTKRFTFANAFHSDYFWDDGLPTGGKYRGGWYGGKFPMAVHGTGQGNMGRRYEIVRNANPEDQEALHSLTQRHAVPQRELALLIHWLEASGAAPTEKSVRELIRLRLNQAFVDGVLPLALVGNPRPDTGVHPSLDAIVLADRVHVLYVPFVKAVHYHRSSECKTVPGKFRASPALLALEGKGIKFASEEHKAMLSCPLDEAKARHLNPCPWCCEPTRK
ncbi:hypothetical protein ACN47A_25350 [Myxococcus fulvus]|uniref:hypothetical protein n=1 Tax=Myxococcus fulvus TaxID=33 RepID=UPI003B9A2876